MLPASAGKTRTRRPIPQRLRGSLVVVKRDPPANAPARLDHRAIRLGENLFIFKAAPQPFDEDVVEKPPLTVHADPHPHSLQFIDEPRGGELHTLIGVENLRSAMLGQRFLNRLDTDLPLPRD